MCGVISVCVCVCVFVCVMRVCDVRSVFVELGDGCKLALSPWYSYQACDNRV